MKLGHNAIRVNACSIRYEEGTCFGQNIGREQIPYHEIISISAVL